MLASSRSRAEYDMVGWDEHDQAGRPAGTLAFMLTFAGILGIRTRQPATGNWQFQQIASVSPRPVRTLLVQDWISSMVQREFPATAARRPHISFLPSAFSRLDATRIGNR